MTRNKFESDICNKIGTKYKYESLKLRYVVSHTYTPDFIDETNKVIIETKGRMLGKDRAKMIEVRKQNPGWRIIFVFQDPNKKISSSPKSKSYREWAEKNDFEWILGADILSGTVKLDDFLCS